MQIRRGFRKSALSGAHARQSGPARHPAPDPCRTGAGSQVWRSRAIRVRRTEWSVGRDTGTAGAVTVTRTCSASPGQSRERPGIRSRSSPGGTVPDDRTPGLRLCRDLHPACPADARFAPCSYSSAAINVRRRALSFRSTWCRTFFRGHQLSHRHRRDGQDPENNVPVRPGARGSNIPGWALRNAFRRVSSLWCLRIAITSCTSPYVIAWLRKKISFRRVSWGGLNQTTRRATSRRSRCCRSDAMPVLRSSLVPTQARAAGIPECAANRLRQQRPSGVHGLHVAPRSSRRPRKM